MAALGTVSLPWNNSIKTELCLLITLIFTHRLQRVSYLPEYWDVLGLLRLLINILKSLLNLLIENKHLLSTYRLLLFLKIK
jgi:hypothetical protein